jgi:putative FmdB family regulatory protein
MPKYEYGCLECETTAEVFRGFNDREEIPVCEECGESMKRVYGSFGIQFKGSGFYRTDNGKK